MSLQWQVSLQGNVVSIALESATSATFRPSRFLLECNESEGQGAFSGTLPAAKKSHPHEKCTCICLFCKHSYSVKIPKSCIDGFKLLSAIGREMFLQYHLFDASFEDRRDAAERVAFITNILCWVHGVPIYSFNNAYLLVAHQSP